MIKHALANGLSSAFVNTAKEIIPLVQSHQIFQDMFACRYAKQLLVDVTVLDEIKLLVSVDRPTELGFSKYKEHIVTGVKYIKGDLIALSQVGTFDVLIHGCNCFNTMSKGLSRAIAKAYPRVGEIDIVTDMGSRDKLGLYTIAVCGKLHIVNAYIAHGTTDITHYPSLSNVLRMLAKELPNMCGKDKSQIHIGMSKIGCGAGHANWSEVLEIINVRLNKYQVTIVTP